MKGIKIRINRRIKISPLCGEYPSSGFLIYLLKGEEEITLDIILEMVFENKVYRISFFWEVVYLWHWK